MCGRYALAGDADEIPLALYRQFNPGHRDSVQPDADNQDETNTTDNSLADHTDETQPSGQSSQGFTRASDLPRGLSGSAGGMSPGGEGGAGLGRSGERSLGEGLPIDWVNETAKGMYRKRYNVAPSTRCPIVRRDPSTGQLVVDSLKWGIIPHWSKDMHGNHPINARDDGIKSGSGMWSGLRNKKRCLVVMDGWYEWTQKGNKEAYYTKHTDNRLVIMGGLWDSCKLPGTDHPIDTFTIVTTHSNPQLNFLHGRMPVILDSPAELELWLSAEPWGPKLEKLLRPYGKKLECYKVPPEVGKVANESPDFIKPLNERKGGIASLFAKQAAHSPSKTDPPYDSPKSAPKLASTSAERKPKAKVPLPSKIDTYFGKGARVTKGPKRKAAEASDDDSSDLEVIESPAKRAKKVVVKEGSPAGGEEVKVVTEKDDGEVEVEERGVQEVENPA